MCMCMCMFLSMCMCTNRSFRWHCTLTKSLNLKPETLKEIRSPLHVHLDVYVHVHVCVCERGRALSKGDQATCEGVCGLVCTPEPLSATCTATQLHSQHSTQHS